MYCNCIITANITRVIKIATFMYYISCIVYVYKFLALYMYKNSL